MGLQTVYLVCVSRASGSLKRTIPTRDLLQRILPALQEGHLPLHAVHLTFRPILPYRTELASDDLEPISVWGA